jgi:hypothetical protein
MVGAARVCLSVLSARAFLSCQPRASVLHTRLCTLSALRGLLRHTFRWDVASRCASRRVASCRVALVLRRVVLRLVVPSVHVRAHAYACIMRVVCVHSHARAQVRGLQRPAARRPARVQRPLAARRAARSSRRRAAAAATAAQRAEAAGRGQTRQSQTGTLLLFFVLVVLLLVLVHNSSSSSSWSAAPVRAPGDVFAA